MTVRRVRLPLALLVDVLGAYAFASVAVQVLSGANGPGPSLLVVAAVAAGSFLLARLLREMDLDETAMRNAGAAVSVVALYAVLHFEYAPLSAPWDFGWLRTLISAPNEYSEDDAHVFAGVIVLTVLWLRGVLRGRETLDVSGVLASGTIGLAAMALAAATLPSTHGPDVFGGIALFYVVAFLAVLALYQAPDPDGPVRAFVARWSGAAAGLIGGALALTVVAAAIDPAAFGFIAPIDPLALAVEMLRVTRLGRSSAASPGSSTRSFRRRIRRSAGRPRAPTETSTSRTPRSGSGSPRTSWRAGSWRSWLRPWSRGCGWRSGASAARAKIPASAATT
jgi:hypothetical protein